MEHKKLFEQIIAARTLATALEPFPVPLDLRPYDILMAEGLSLTEDNFIVAESTLSWLHDEGLLRCKGKGPAPDKTGKFRLEFRKSTLSSAGFDALNQPVNVSGESVGDVLVDELRKTGGDARSAVISEIIGQIIGAASKSIFGGG